MQLDEAYNYVFYMQTKQSERIRSIWAEFLSHEINHFNTYNDLLLKDNVNKV